MTDSIARLPLSRIAVHTVTTRPWSLETCIEEYARRGFGGICVWREHLEDADLSVVRRSVHDAGLRVASLVRGGFFVSPDTSERARAIDDTRRAIDEAAAIGAPTVVIVPGAHPDVPRGEARAQVVDGLASLADHARANDVVLGVEPLHPMFAADRSCLCTLEEAMDVVRRVDHAALGLVLDVYHLWWQQDLAEAIAQAGSLNVPLTFHVSDWVTPDGDALTSRALMGEGCIPIRSIRSMVESAGFDGLVEVELLSARGWAADQHEWLDRIAASCERCV